VLKRFVLKEVVMFRWIDSKLNALHIMLLRLRYRNGNTLDTSDKSSDNKLSDPLHMKPMNEELKHLVRRMELEKNLNTSDSQKMD